MSDPPTVTWVRAAASGRGGRARPGDARRHSPAGPDRARDRAAGARRLVVRGVRMLPLGAPPGQPPRAADGARRDAVAARADDDAASQSRRVHGRHLVHRPLDRRRSLCSCCRSRAVASGRARTAPSSASSCSSSSRSSSSGSCSGCPENGLNILAIAPDESAAKVVDTIQRALISFGSVLLIIVVLSALAGVQRPGPAPDGAGPRRCGRAHAAD